MLTVGIFYFGPFKPFYTLPYPFTSHLPSIFQLFSTYILISSTVTSYVMQYYWCSVILFYFPSFPKFHRIVLLLQTCPTSEFVYHHVCFHIYVYFLALYSTHERKHAAFGLSEPSSLHLTWWPPVTSIYLQTKCHCSLWLSKTPLCISITFSWPIH
jgi:hypothetical protein